MALLSDIRGMFARRRPVMVNLRSTSERPRTHAAVANVEAKYHQSPSGAEDDDDGMAGASAFARALKPSSLHLDEVMSLVRGMATHVEKQTARTDRLVTSLERLPQALEALPEINRLNTRLLEMVGDYLDHSRRRDNALTGTLNGITEASNRHAEVLGLLQQQLDAGSQATETLTTQLAGFRETLGQLAGSNARTTAVLSDLAQSNESREVELTRLLGRTQNWLLGAMICCAAMSAAAIAVAAIALLG